MRDLAKSRTQVFIYLIFISSIKVRVRVSCRVRFNNSHMSRKSRTASYLAIRHIWHDTGSLGSPGQMVVKRQCVCVCVCVYCIVLFGTCTETVFACDNGFVSVTSIVRS